MRALDCHCAHRAVASWLFAVPALLLSLSACRAVVPAVDTSTSPRPVAVDGTISGTVRGPAGAGPVDGRPVEIMNVDTGERQRTATNNAGGFTFRLKPGKYRIDLTLRDGEKLIRQPDVISLDRSDVDAHVDFVLGASRVARPRYYSPRADDGLGSAIG